MIGIEACVLDADGTLIDTVQVITDTYQAVALDSGFEIPSTETIAALIGRPLSECYEAVAPEDADIEVLMNRHREFSAEGFSEVLAFDGITVELEKIKRAGLPLGVFSSRSGTLEASLKSAGIYDLFDVVVEGNHPDVAQGKPKPDGVIVAHALLGADLRRGSYIGDADVDIQAGNAAGVFTVGVTWGNGTPAELGAASPNVIISNPNKLAEVLLNN